MKKRTILKMFIIPLILVMLVQALITYGTVILGGSTSLLARNSVDILSQAVESRKILIENNMVQQWSNIKEEKEQMDANLKAILQREEISIQEFMDNDKLQSELLHEMLSPCLYMLRKNAVTGSFMIVGNPKAGAEEDMYNGVYFRDIDPLSNPGGYSDVLMERGNSEFAHELGIPLDYLWTTDFHFAEPGVKERDNFFYRPYQAAQENPEASYKNLAYWSEPFLLTRGTEKDSYQIITYSIPLVYEGQIYGVMGIEVSRNYFLKQISAQNTSSNDNSSYMLARYDAESGQLMPLVYSGVLAERMSNVSKAITIDETEYNDLYQVEDITSVTDPIYVSVSELHLYNSNTPFENEVWALVGIKEHESLFGFSDKITFNLLTGILIAFLFSCIAIYFIATHITSPIRKLAESIRTSSDNQLTEYKISNIREVDELYDVVHNLTEKQKENEYKLLEEKERYRIALRSSTDVLFTYDIKKAELELISFNSEQSGESEQSIYRQIGREEILQAIQPEHRRMVSDVVKSGGNEVKAVLQVKLKKEADFEWIEMKGTIIKDADGVRSKIIGSIKNINQEKLNELRQLEEQRQDLITGLLKKEAGKKLIESELKYYNKGCLALLDIDGFRAINEEYGMILGDSILEEIGKIIRNMINEDIVGIRIGGDEILLWFSGFSLSDTWDFITVIQEKAKGLYPNSTLCIELSAGVREVAGENFSYEQLLTQVKKELFLVKKEKGSNISSFEQLNQEREINGIARISYSGKPNIISQVFNFFDKGGDFSNVMAVMLTKLGNYFSAEAIRVVIIDWDFHAAYLNYWWQAESGSEDLSEIRYFSSGEFDELIESISDRTNKFLELEELLPLQRKVLFVSNYAEGISVPMYDRECYIGSVSFVQQTGGSEKWGERDKNDIQEIVKIIESNINREKHDLASQAKSDFLSRMSHEIRTPMNAIIGMTTIALLEKEKEDKVEECLTKISQSSYYLLGLINHILDMSKIESGKMKLDVKNLNLNEMISGIENMILPQAESKNIYYRVEKQIVNEWVLGDELRLSQVLVNLLGNAVKFTPAEGNIVLSIEQTILDERQTRVKFSVRDDGIGVSAENKERIFLSFEQVENIGKREYAGTGLGLSISSHLIHMMGGKIELDSQPDQGSDFYFTLLMEIGEAEKKKSMDIDLLEDSSLKGSRVLLVEDNSLNVEIAQTLMEMQGFIVDVALDGQEAVDKYAASSPGYYDVILMDIRMPVMDGLEATKRIRQMERNDMENVPIIAMTANAFDEDMKKSIECGMNGHLAKPIDIQQLTETIKKIFIERQNEK